jgi:hypothetical protein
MCAKGLWCHWKDLGFEKPDFLAYAYHALPSLQELWATPFLYGQSCVDLDTLVPKALRYLE